MPKIHITDEAARAIRGAATAPGGFQQTGHQRPDGSWDVPVEEDTLDRIQVALLEGETISDCIVRIVATSKGGLN